MIGPAACDRDQDIDPRMRLDEACDIGDLVDRHRHRTHPGRNQQGHHARGLFAHEQLAADQRLVGDELAPGEGAGDGLWIGEGAVGDAVARPADQFDVVGLEFRAERNVLGRDHDFDRMRHRALHFGLASANCGKDHNRGQHRAHCCKDYEHYRSSHLCPQFPARDAPPSGPPAGQNPISLTLLARGRRARCVQPAPPQSIPRLTDCSLRLPAPEFARRGTRSPPPGPRASSDAGAWGLFS